MERCRRGEEGKGRGVGDWEGKDGKHEEERKEEQGKGGRGGRWGREKWGGGSG